MSIPTPDLDLANYLAASPIVTTPLVLGVNLYAAPELPQFNGVPSAAVFVATYGGGTPEPHMGPITQLSNWPASVQCRVRSNPGDYPGGLLLARQVRDAAHRATIGAYYWCLAQQGEPIYLGSDDRNRHRWSVNVEMRIARSGKPTYLIPDSLLGIFHANASDLNAGTAKVGPPLIKIGSPAFNPNSTPRPSVGPFPLGNRFTSLSTHPLGPLGGGQWTMVMLLNQLVTSDQGVVFSWGNNIPRVQFYPNGSNLYLSLAAGVETVNGPVTGTMNVAIIGSDNAGNGYAQLNGGATQIVAGASSSEGPGGAPVVLGDIATLGTPWGGAVYELFASLDVPSPSAFSALYNQIIASQ